MPQPRPKQTQLIRRKGAGVVAVGVGVVEGQAPENSEAAIVGVVRKAFRVVVGVAGSRGVGVCEEEIKGPL